MEKEKIEITEEKLEKLIYETAKSVMNEKSNFWNKTKNWARNAAQDLSNGFNDGLNGKNYFKKNDKNGSEQSGKTSGENQGQPGQGQTEQPTNQEQPDISGIGNKLMRNIYSSIIRSNKTSEQAIEIMKFMAYECGLFGENGINNMEQAKSQIAGFITAFNNKKNQIQNVPNK